LSEVEDGGHGIVLVDLAGLEGGKNSLSSSLESQTSVSIACERRKSVN
jgi:hypothetical protein